MINKKMFSFRNKIFFGLLGEKAVDFEECEFMENEISKSKNIHAGEFFESIIGIELVEKIVNRYCEILMDDDWLGKLYYAKSKDVLIKDQVEFIKNLIKNNGKYVGKSLKKEYAHIYISDEMFELRQSILKGVLQGYGFTDKIVGHWLKIDYWYLKSTIKNDISECVVNCPGQFPLVAKKPAGYKFSHKVFENYETLKAS